ncbi:MAG: hypothetical protein RIT81_07150 [Deltaproteobacteria bacterium]
MGLGRRIGRAFRRVTRVVRRVTNFAKDAIGVVTKPLSSLANKALGVVGQVLDKLPFGNVIKQFAGQFLNNPLSLLAMGPLGGIGALAQMAGGSAGLSQLVNVFAGSAGMQNPLGAQNLMNIVAQQHARSFFRQ